MIISKKEFASKTKLKTSTLAVYISRGLVVVNKDGKIDTTNPENDLFLSTHNPKAKEELKSLNAQKKALEIERLKAEIKLSEMKAGKMEGNLLPYDLVCSVVKRANQNILVAFVDQFRNMVRDLERQKIISPNQREEYSKRMVEVITNASQVATRATHKDIDIYLDSLEIKTKGK